MDTRTDAEKRYDAERDGTLYRKPEAPPADESLLDHYLANAAAIDAVIEPIFEQKLRELLGDDPPAVEMSRLEPDPADDPEQQPCPATEFRCGNILLEILDDPSDDVHGGRTVYDGGDGISLDQAEQHMQALSAILADPRVQVLLGRGPVIRVEPHIADAELAGPQFAGKVAWIDYIAGEDDGQVEVSISTRHRANNRPCVFLPGKNEISYRTVERWMPALIALMGDARVRAAVDAWYEKAKRP